MKATVSQIKLNFDEHDKPELTLALNMSRHEAMADISELRKIFDAGKLLSVELKQYREKRSLDANSYFWLILSKIASILHTTKDELYLTMLERYGVFTHVIVKPEAAERVKQEWRTVRDLGEVTVNGKIGVQIQCYYGSSTYNTKEMSVLIDGIVQDAKELDIETMTPKQLSLLKSEWGR